jgi:hypothetical protein
MDGGATMHVAARAGAVAARPPGRPAAADLRVEGVAAVITLAWVDRRLRRKSGPRFIDQGAARWCGARHILLGALGVEGPTSRTTH